jgi:hypothetical protein
VHNPGRRWFVQKGPKSLSLLRFWPTIFSPTGLDSIKTDRQTRGRATALPLRFAVFCCCLLSFSFSFSLRNPVKTPKKNAVGAANDNSEQSDAQTDALTVLRAETALSRFPMHRLTKGAVEIELVNQASAVLWRVDHNSRYGQPGPLAYKLDSLFINRRIEESGRPVPKVIRLGSLREIAQEVDLGTNTNAVKQALLQNATASITAKISYRTQEGGEQWLEAVFNRYSVVFTGEKLPGGGAADAVYLILNDLYQQILSNAVYRPLDYDYMRALPPSSQRFYEVVSYQIYAALKFRNPRAKLAYSEYCLLSTVTRYGDFEHVKKQMYKVLQPHLKSGYLAKVEYEAVTDELGAADWMMYLTPGANADREYRAFTGQGMLRKPAKAATKASTQAAAKGAKVKASDSVQTLSLPFPDASESNASQQTPPSTAESVAKTSTASGGVANDATNQPAIDASEDAARELIAALREADLNTGDAERLVRERPDVCRRQLAYLPFVKEFKTSRGAYLRRAIEGDYGPPASYSQNQVQQEREQEQGRRRAQELFEAGQKKARQKHEERFSGAFALWVCAWVGEWEKSRPEASAAFLRYEREKKASLGSGPFADRPLTRHALESFDVPQVRADRVREFCRGQGRAFDLPMPTFWEWDETFNPEPFQP